jgi:inosose dehydratase
MKIAYGTYGMPGLAPEVALPALAEMGYEGVELALGPKYPTCPDKLDCAAREQLGRLLTECGLAVPALMLLVNVLTEDPTEHQRNLGELRKAADLALDLDARTPPVLTFTMGGNRDRYEEQRNELARRLRDYAAVATEKGVLLAAEPHVGGTIDRPDRAVWLIEAVDSPVVRLNFDISHFDLLGLGIDECVTPLVPLSIHTHVKDGFLVDGKVQFLLPGEGDFDYVAYLRAMKAAGWDGFICVEISGQLWGREGYDPLAAARQSYESLAAAFQEAGVQP